jgi:hypothetical protein
VTIRFDFGAQSTLVTSLSCYQLAAVLIESNISQSFDFSESRTFLGVDIDVTAIGSDGYLGPIDIERKGEDWADMKLICLRRGHVDRTGGGSTVV